MTRWGMVIDLKKCVGCYACVVACKQEHFLPPNVFWNRVMVSEVGEFPTVRKLVYPVLCNQCKDAICLDVCPSNATFKREDGIVIIDADKCTGCQYCIIACPYQQRTFLDNAKIGYFSKQGLTEVEKLGKLLYPLQSGTTVKCNFCLERIDYGLSNGLRPGVDREATPACVNICMTKARHFGDFDDPDSNVSRLIRQRKAHRLHEEWATNPSVYYLD